MNAVMLIGNLASDVELRTVDGDRKVANFLLAVDRPGKDGQADFFRIATWNRQAEVCEQFLSRGKLVAIDGRLRSRSWEDSEGRRRSAVEVVTQNVEFLSMPERTVETTEAAALEPVAA